MGLETSESLYTAISVAFWVALLWLAYILGKNSLEPFSNAFKYMLALSLLVYLVFGTRFMYVGLGDLLSKFITTSNLAERKQAEEDLTTCKSASETHAEEDKAMMAALEKDRQQFEADKAALTQTASLNAPRNVMEAASHNIQSAFM
jgi:hypothetical protein